MKKILSIITAAVLAVGALAGCAANETQTQKSPVEGSKTAYIINIPQSDIFTNCAEACAFTDFRANGEQGIRVLALELNNEYDSITDADGAVSDFIEIPASLITQEKLIENGGSVYASDSENNATKDYLVTSDWLAGCIGY